jgi:peptidoglycan/LPS O-acetylase OafA/YrhL
MDFTTVWTLIATKHYMMLAIIVVGYLWRICASDSNFPVDIPTRWRTVLVIVLSQIYSTLIAHAKDGASWNDAITHGFFTAFIVLGLGTFIIQGVFNGNEPRWLKWFAWVPKPLQPAPTPPPVDEVSAKDEKIEEKKPEEEKKPN